MPASKTRWSDLSRVIAWKDCPEAPDWETDSLGAEEFYLNGVNAIEALGKSVKNDLKSNVYTHILVLVMGWNTAQDESIRNFNDIAGNLIEAARESEIAKTDSSVEKPLPFRPLVIGVSWPSFWSKGLTNLFSYPNKAKDADELGISWLNLLTNRILPDAIASSGRSVPIITIGHSFGGRAVTRAASSSPALSSPSLGDSARLRTGASLVVALQGAVSINRFWPLAGDEGAPLRDFAELRPTRFAFTASKHDSAAGGPVFWFDPSGSARTYELACGPTAGWRAKVFRCLTASDSSGRQVSMRKHQRREGFKICDSHDCSYVGDKLSLVDDQDKALYIDVTDGITEFNTLGTGGDAHSDIYRLPMGRLLWMIISSLPTPDNGSFHPVRWRIDNQTATGSSYSPRQ